MVNSPESTFDPHSFAASAAALVASHAMSDAVWKTYFPELPAKQPELRTVLINIHRHALKGAPQSLSQARQQVIKEFSVTLGAAIKWIDILEDLGFLVRLEGPRKGAHKIVPSAQGKEGLYKVGQEYLICLRLVNQQLRQAMPSKIDPHSIDWLFEVKQVLETTVIDYPTAAKTTP